MREIKIVADTSCELSLKMASDLSVDLVPFNITIDETTQFKDTFDMSSAEFYKKIKENGAHPKTSLPSPGDYLEVFERHAKDGKDIICFCLSSVLSGSYQSALTAANDIRDRYPEIKVYVVDTKLATWLISSIVTDTVELANQGVEAEKIIKAIESAQTDFIGTFTVDSLDQLVRGGRISKIAGVAGNVLDIKPIIHLKDGGLAAGIKLRGRKKAVVYTVDKLYEWLQGKNLADYRIFALYGDNLEDGKEIQRLINQKLDVPESEIFLRAAGSTIGAHTGPTINAAASIARLKV
ncbi:MAG: DegV family protein [Defluviitaleaceae bacterium]|nr:DegV family protein [Defluviitaleaceae bacterium]